MLSAALPKVAKVPIVPERNRESRDNRDKLLPLPPPEGEMRNYPPKERRHEEIEINNQP